MVYIIMLYIVYYYIVYYLFADAYIANDSRLNIRSVYNPVGPFSPD